MKRIRKFFQTSLRNQFIGVMSSFILVFLIGAACLFLYNQYITDEYQAERGKLDEKEAVVEQLDRAFNKAFFDARGYIAFERIELKESIYRQEIIIQDTIEKFRTLAIEPGDQKFIEDVEEFSSYYFQQIVANAIANLESGNVEAVKKASADGGTATVDTFQRGLNDYEDRIEQKSDEAYEDVKRKESFSQGAFVLFIFLMLLVLMRIMRLLAKQIGLPLNQVATAAERIAEDESYKRWSFENNRKDEIGKVSRAFEKMIHRIQLKEEDLLAHNEELVAQQDELELQQSKLEHLLNVAKSREQQLERRNKFINGISHSLNKQEVLDSIVQTMCGVIDASRGMIVLLDEHKSHAAFGISEKGAHQFLDYLHNGLHQRLFEQKEPFSIKRELVNSEKGYHEETSFSYDLFIPVLSLEKEVEAIMVFSRFDHDFSSEEIEEYKSLSKQISISLQKIHLFEETEKDRHMNQEILNNIQEGIQLVDNNGNSMLMNTKFSKIIKGELCALQQSPYEEWKQALLSQVENSNGLNRYYEMVIEGGKAGRNLHTYHLEEGTAVYQVYSESLYRGDEKIGTIFVHRDITKEFEVDQMKSDFVSTVSHELRTPLSSVLGFTELMLTKDLKPERTKKYLTTIYQEAKRLTSLINDFLDVQRMESGRQTFDKRYEDIVPIIQNAINAQKVNAPNHTFTIEKDTDCTMVLGDKDKLSQAFTNLISNAIKYSPDGGNITARVYEKQEKVFINIVDEGLGIPADAFPKLFTKFYRVDNSDRRRIGGTGLGLTIVKEIIENHDGSIRVASEIGRGSTFTLSLPMVTLQTFKEEESNGDGMTITVIEDDINLASLLTTELSGSGFQVQHAKTGASAIEKINEHKPDAVVLDIMLEGSMTGWDVLETLKANEELCNIPIIISSALDEKEKGITLGAVDYLVKPYHPSELSKTILHLLLKSGRNGEVLIPFKDE
jgi:signal transduction histidine kinase/CheY-like chemotaxis protein/CHASE3 domain sensor protein